jgi:hypothetical protein
MAPRCGQILISVKDELGRKLDRFEEESVGRVMSVLK